MLQKLEFNPEQNDLVQQGALTVHKEDNAILLMTVPEHEFWKSVHTEKEEPMCVFAVKEIEPGIYQSGLNFNHSIASYTDYKDVGSYERLNKDGLPVKYEQGNSMMDYFENTIECYGVADNVEQIKAHYRAQIESDNPMVISITEINKKNQPEEGGWRWEKWGKYIGNRESQAEYIVDEPEIESVYVFHVHAVQLKEQLNNTAKPKRKM